MTLKKITILVVALSAFVLAGCAGKPVTFQNVTPDTDRTAFNFENGREISASASGLQLLLLIPISINDRQERAYELLRAQAGGDYISDIKIQESWSWAFVGTVYKTTIKAKAYPRKAQ